MGRWRRSVAPGKVQGGAGKEGNSLSGQGGDSMKAMRTLRSGSGLEKECGELAYTLCRNYSVVQDEP